MPLPEPIRSHWYAALEREETFLRTPWGGVVTSARYPRVYEANHASVLERAPDLTADDIRGVLLPALEASGARAEHVEFLDAGDPSPALDELTEHSPTVDPDVVMVFEADLAPEPAPSDVRVVVTRHPDADFWAMHRRGMNEFGEVLEDAVVDQMVDRIRKVFVPAGLRFFAGIVEGRYAGYASTLTLHGSTYVDNVVTMPEFRRRGVAAATVSRAVADALGPGERSIFLLAEEDGAPSRLYERLGFRVLCRSMGFTRRLA